MFDINVFMVAYLIVLAEPPLCECDNRGRKINENYGDWCYLNERPCKLLTGDVVDWNWARCVWKKSTDEHIQLVECPAVGNDLSSPILIPAFYT